MMLRIKIPMAGLLTEAFAQIEDRDPSTRWTFFAPPGSDFQQSRIEDKGLRVRVPLLTALLLLLSGCIAIPTPEHGGPYIAKETFLSLEAGKTQRAEVLMRFGDPAERLQEDRFLIYPWERIAGYVFVGGYGGGAVGGWTRGHFLCLEFTPDGMLKRFVHLEGVWGDALRRRLEAWMAEP
jgi:hypothetical protein